LESDSLDHHALVPDDAAIRERLAFYARVMRSYIPRPYPGPVNVIKAEDRPPRALQDATLNWSRVADTIHVQTVPGDHMSMVSHGLGALSAALREQLSRLASHS
jgi:thioesterase domain-containing protein